MKIASYKTLNTNRKTRLSYAYNAIEREAFCGELDREKDGREAMNRLNTMKKQEMLTWALRNVEYWELTNY